MATPIARWLQKHIGRPLDRMYARLDEHSSGVDAPNGPEADAPASDVPAPVKRVHRGHDRAA